MPSLRRLVFSEWDKQSQEILLVKREMLLGELGCDWKWLSPVESVLKFFYAFLVYF